MMGRRHESVPSERASREAEGARDECKRGENEKGGAGLRKGKRSSVAGLT